MAWKPDIRPGRCWTQSALAAAGCRKRPKAGWIRMNLRDPAGNSNGPAAAPKRQLSGSLCSGRGSQQGTGRVPNGHRGQADQRACPHPTAPRTAPDLKRKFLLGSSPARILTRTSAAPRAKANIQSAAPAIPAPAATGGGAAIARDRWGRRRPGPCRTWRPSGAQSPRPESRH
jgi:hypothetical protein